MYWPRQVLGPDGVGFQRPRTKESQSYWCLWSTQTSSFSDSQRSVKISDLIKVVLQANLPPSWVSKFPFSPSLCISREEKSFEDKSLCAASGEERREMSGEKQYVSSIHEKNPTPEHFVLFIRISTNKLIPSKDIYSNLQFFTSVI